MSNDNPSPVERYVLGSSLPERSAVRKAYSRVFDIAGVSMPEPGVVFRSIQEAKQPAQIAGVAGAVSSEFQRYLAGDHNDFDPDLWWALGVVARFASRLRTAAKAVIDVSEEDRRRLCQAAARVRELYCAQSDGDSRRTAIECFQLEASLERRESADIATLGLLADVMPQLRDCVESAVESAVFVPEVSAYVTEQ